MLAIGGAALVLLASGAGAPAADATATLVITQSWSRPTPPAASGAAVYLSITNRGSRPDRLLALHTPVAQSAEIHESRMLNGMVDMHELAALDCPAHGSVKLQPGGVHVMLLGLQRPLAPGTVFPLTLRFELAGELTVQVHVSERD